MGLILVVACAITYAQQTVYKWVDEDGVVHFSDEPPKACLLYTSDAADELR